MNDAGERAISNSGSGTPQYWLNLQADHDLKQAEARIGPRLRAIRPVAHASSP